MSYNSMGAKVVLTNPVGVMLGPDPPSQKAIWNPRSESKNCRRVELLPIHAYQGGRGGVIRGTLAFS